MSLSFAALRPRLVGSPIAHRGLWSAEGAPENSLAAFRAARADGFGVELDVRLSADGQAVVFHDSDLERMTGETGPLTARGLSDLQRLTLLGTPETIPTLAQALGEIGPDTLVLIECKTPSGQEGPLEAAVAEALDAHAGTAAVIGFNPMTHAWFAEHRPKVARGLNSYGYTDSAPGVRLTEAERAALARFEAVDVARPDFILPGLDIVASAPVARLRRQGLPVVAWTVRTPQERASVEVYADNLIFEGEALG